MTTKDTLWALEELIRALPDAQRHQAAGALRTIKELLGGKP